MSQHASQDTGISWVGVGGGGGGGGANCCTRPRLTQCMRHMPSESVWSGAECVQFRLFVVSPLPPSLTVPGLTGWGEWERLIVYSEALQGWQHVPSVPGHLTGEQSCPRLRPHRRRNVRAFFIKILYLQRRAARRVQTIVSTRCHTEGHRYAYVTKAHSLRFQPQLWHTSCFSSYCYLTTDMYFFQRKIRNSQRITPTLNIHI